MLSVENNLRTRIGHLQEYRRMGMTTLAAVEHAEGDRRKREAEQNKKKNREMNYGAQKRGREEVSRSFIHLVLLLFHFVFCNLGVLVETVTPPNCLK